MSKANEIIYNAYVNNRQTIEKWLSYPRQLQMEYGINPILAGGCMRDIILGGDVNDLDVFITVSKARLDPYDHGHDFDGLIRRIAEKEGWTLDHDTEGSGGELVDGCKVPHRELHSIWSFQSEFVDKPYNIIVLPDDIGSQQIIGEFDFGINMIAVNTYSILATNKYFLEDVELQRVTVRNESSKERRDRRYQELLLKYPEIPLMSAEGLELDKPHSGLILPPGVNLSD